MWEHYDEEECIGCDQQIPCCEEHEPERYKRETRKMEARETMTLYRYMLGLAGCGLEVTR